MSRHASDCRCWSCIDVENRVNDLEKLRAGGTLVQPIPMVLYCPACGVQHIDAPEPEEIIQRGKLFGVVQAWDNPPHRSHLCHACGFIWRPADVPTMGVASIETKGKNDNGPVTKPRCVADFVQRVPELCKATHFIFKRPRGSVYVKEAGYFISQGGLRDDWGSLWMPVVASSMEDARRIGAEL